MVVSFTAKTPLHRHFSAVLKSHSFLLLRRPPKAVTMAEIRPGKQKRPTCATCSKPAWLCLCARIKTGQLENSVTVTVLQHSLEKKHPLNSVRIALLGLKNVAVSTVSDVNFEARFGIRLFGTESELGPFCGLNGVEADQAVEGGNVAGFAHQVFEKCPIEISTSFKLESDISCVEKNQNQFESLDFDQNSGFLGSDDVTSFEAEDSDRHVAEQCDDKKLSNLGSTRGNEGSVVTFTIRKQGEVSSLFHIWAGQTCSGKPNFDTILENRAARDAIAKGFVVQKLQKRQREGSVEVEEYVEFEITVPPGSALLFPSKEAVGVEGLKAIGFEAKNLIVLDGTWAKAKRMYAENPWLKLLPHLKLEVDKVSLYNGVRMQPKAGCLSTIESIVYALKALGDDNLDGLDDLLDVFDSMVGDQRQCKEKRLRSASLL